MQVRNIVKSIQQIMWKDSGVDGDAQRLSQLCWMFFLKIIDDQETEFSSAMPEKLRWRNWAYDKDKVNGKHLIKFINNDLFPSLKNLSSDNKLSKSAVVISSVFEDAHNYMKDGDLVRQIVEKISLVNFADLAERKNFGDIYEQLLNDLQAAGNAGEFYTPRAVTAFMVNRINPRPGEIIYDPSCGTGGFLTCSIRHMRDAHVKNEQDELLLQSGLRASELKQLPHMLCITNMLLHNIKDPSFVKHENTLARPYGSFTSDDEVDIITTNPPFGATVQEGIENNFPQKFRTKETTDLFLYLIIRLLKPNGRAAVVLPDGSLFGEGVRARLRQHLMEECNVHTIVRLPNSVFKPYASIGTSLLFFEKGRPTKDVWFYEHRVPTSQKSYSTNKPMLLEHLNDCAQWWGGESREARSETPVAWKVPLQAIKDRDYSLDFKNPHQGNIDYGDPEDLIKELNSSNESIKRLRKQLTLMLENVIL